jgi:hypothetical protein
VLLVLSTAVAREGRESDGAGHEEVAEVGRRRVAAAGPCCSKMMDVLGGWSNLFLEIGIEGTVVTFLEFSGYFFPGPFRG